MNKHIVPVALLFAISTADLIAQGIADTPQNRQREAERYLQTMSPKALFADAAEKAAMNVPPADRQKFKDTLTSEFDFDALTKAMTAAMVKHFSTEELKALADLYNSPVGKSAKSKFGTYMADVMSALQAEMTKAQAKVK
jgi:hypothetical protein